MLGESKRLRANMHAQRQLEDFGIAGGGDKPAASRTS